MAKPLLFEYLGTQVSIQIDKVDRSDLYGYKKVETVDDQGRKCLMAMLADDGRTLIGRGGTGVGYVTADGNWCSKSDLIPVDLEGNRIEPVPSSYSAPIPLNRVITVDEYLLHNIRAVYRATFLDSADALRAELERGTIFGFDYSFRGGLEYDAGFLLRSADGTDFVAIGVATPFQFLELPQAAPTVDDDSTEDADDDGLSFDMI